MITGRQSFGTMEATALLKLHWANFHRRLAIRQYDGKTIYSFNMDYKLLHKQTKELLDAEEKVNEYMQWLERNKTDQTVTGIAVIDCTVFKRKPLRLELTQSEIYELLFSRMNRANGEFLKKKVEFDKQHR